jgi:hypothetical protein
MPDIQAPDGTIARFPDGMSDADIMAVMRRSYPAPASSQPESDYTSTHSQDEGSAGPVYNAAPSLKGAARALENNLPFAPEAVAGLQSILPQGYGGTGQGYEANRAAQYSQNAQYQAENPGTDLAGAGVALAPALAARGMAAAPYAASAASKILPLAAAILRHGVGPAVGGGIGGYALAEALRHFKP